MRDLLLATTNPGKLREMDAALAGLGFRVLSLRDAGIAAVAPETGATFAENARQKAAFYRSLGGLPTLAEDSGLCVEALDGAPGVHSARYGAESGVADDTGRNRRLLAALAGVLPPRRARYECALALDAPGAPLVEASGRVEGEILDAPRGAGGFGYDPLFFYPPYGRAFAEVTPAEKAAVSHRTAALRALAAALRAPL